MEIYLVYRYFVEDRDSCVIKAFVNEEDAIKFKERRTKELESQEKLDCFYICPIQLVK